ncbi:hypothetical protein [Nocardia brasiliensis]|nr:hypothetical protein [Nocardia brasiliensis]
MVPGQLPLSYLPQHPGLHAGKLLTLNSVDDLDLELSYQQLRCR